MRQLATVVVGPVVPSSYGHWVPLLLSTVLPRPWISGQVPSLLESELALPAPRAGAELRTDLPCTQLPAMADMGTGIFQLPGVQACQSSCVRIPKAPSLPPPRALGTLPPSRDLGPGLSPSRHSCLC